MFTSKNVYQFKSMSPGNYARSHNKSYKAWYQESDIAFNDIVNNACSSIKNC